MKVTNENIKLTICVSTYNQKDFIAECLESLINQEVSFQFEIVVSDDASTDGTRLIVNQYAEMYPNLIRNVSLNTNGGPFANYMNVHKNAKGEYVAHMDGDDVALPGKIHAQVNFLDNNPECSVVWHRMIFFNERISIEHPLINEEFVEKKIYEKELCLLGPFGPHSSTMYRKENFNINDFTGKCDDWLMSLFYLKKGYAFMLKSVLGKYRLRSESMSSGAVATSANRLLSTESQKMAVKYLPEFKRQIATRAFANFVLDVSRLKYYSVMSIMVIIRSCTLPLFSKYKTIYEFYQWSKLPNIFKK